MRRSPEFVPVLPGQKYPDWHGCVAARPPVAGAHVRRAGHAVHSVACVSVVLSLYVPWGHAFVVGDPVPCGQ